MNRDTEDVVARLAQIAELILDGTILGVGSEKTVRQAADLIQSLFDRIDELGHALNCMITAADAAAWTVNTSMMDRAIADARAALHQEGIAPR